MRIYDMFIRDLNAAVLNKLAARSNIAPAGAKSTAVKSRPSKAVMSAPTNDIVPKVDATNLGGGQLVRQIPLTATPDAIQTVRPQTQNPLMPLQIGLLPTVQKVAELKLALLMQKYYPIRISGTTENGIPKISDPTIPNTAPNSDQTKTLKPLSDTMGYQAPQLTPWAGSAIPMNQ